MSYLHEQLSKCHVAHSALIRGSSGDLPDASARPLMLTSQCFSARSDATVKTYKHYRQRRRSSLPQWPKHYLCLTRVCDTGSCPSRILGTQMSSGLSTVLEIHWPTAAVLGLWCTPGRRRRKPSTKRMAQDLQDEPKWPSFYIRCGSGYDLI